ncbi:hypothetical protein HZA33_03835 [Candidatus Pacearchaeota archaeon]|nr:hypothetical protein [Candidatus Pacearchaeota archaeon]
MENEMNNIVDYQNPKNEFEKMQVSLEHTDLIKQIAERCFKLGLKEKDNLFYQMIANNTIFGEDSFFTSDNKEKLIKKYSEIFNDPFFGTNVDGLDALIMFSRMFEDPEYRKEKLNFYSRQIRNFIIQ